MNAQNAAYGKNRGKNRASVNYSGVRNEKKQKAEETIDDIKADIMRIEKEIKLLPARQREAFLMRYWEDMDVAETASAMGCSEGSVKTHCSRATHTLAAALKAKGITL